MLNVLTKRSRFKSGKRHAGVMFLIRDWVSVGLRRRSIALLSKAMTLALKAGIELDDVFNRKGMNHIVPFMFARGEVKKSDLIGPRSSVKDIPQCLIEHVALTASHEPSSYVFGKRTDRGLKSYYFSSDFERDFVTDEEFKDITKKRPCWRPVFDDDNSHAQVIKAIGELYSVAHDVDGNPPIRHLRVQAVKRSGERLIVDITMGLHIASDVESMLLFALRPLAKNIGRTKVNDEVSVPVPVKNTSKGTESTDCSSKNVDVDLEVTSFLSSEENADHPTPGLSPFDVILEEIMKTESGWENDEPHTLLTPKASEFF